MPPGFAVIAVAFSCILLTSVAESCNTNEYTCDNGNCISLGYVCYGGNNCEDNSDERPDICKGVVQGSLFGVPLGASDNLQVAVDLSPNNNAFSVSGSLLVAVCGPSSCSGHQMLGLDDRILSASNTIGTAGNNMGWGVFLRERFAGVQSWAPGILLEVEKHNRLLAVWPSGRPDMKRWTECQPDENTLVISSTTLGNATLLRAGSPADVGPVMAWSEQINVQVLVSSYTSISVQVGLCNARTCAAVQIVTPFRDNITTMDYSTGITRTNNPGDQLVSTIHSSTTGSTYWVPARHQFSVALHPDGFLQVWQPADPSNVAEVPIPEDLKERPVLRVLSSYGNVAYTSIGIKSRKELPVPRMTLGL